MTDSNGNTYYTGEIWEQASVDFGCGTISNSLDSYEDAFVVKFDPAGNCLWQYRLKSTETDPQKDREGYWATDVALTPNENPVVSVTILDDRGNAISNQPNQRWAKVVELSTSGNKLWSDTVKPIDQTDEDSVVIQDIGVGAGRIYAAGMGAGGYMFDNGTHYFGPIAAMQWGARQSGNRARLTARNWGGSYGENYNRPFEIADIAVQPAVGAVVVGNYWDGSWYHHADGSPADDAKNSNMFIQYFERNNLYPAIQWASSWSSQSAPPTKYDHDTEHVTAADFTSEGTLYIAGHFKGYLDPQEELDKNSSDPYIQTRDGSVSQERDSFILEYSSISDLPTQSAKGDASDYGVTKLTKYPAGGGKTYIKDERILDLVATKEWVVFGGSYCQTSPDCGKNGFMHIIDKSANDLPDTGLIFANLTRTYENTSSNDAFPVQDVGFDTSNTRTIVEGLNTEASYSLGGSTLPGTDDFLVSYDVTP